MDYPLHFRSYFFYQIEVTPGVDRQITLILPQKYPADSRLQAVGTLTRIEADRLIVGYSFNLIANEIIPEYQKNPSAGKSHSFVAYRDRQITGPGVAMKKLK